MGTIVIATDGSKAAESAVAEGVELAKRFDARAIFVAVAEPPPDYLGKPLWQEHVTKEMERARQGLDKARELAEAAGIEAEYDILEGEAAKEIARFAEARDADLVVVGTRSIGAAAGALLGSVSSSLVRRSDRPVVVVREPEKRAKEREAEARTPAEPKPAHA